jgi:hypothetical protein
MPMEVIKGFGILKKCAAKINVDNGTLDAKIGNTIIQVSQEIIDGKLDDHFPLVPWLLCRCQPSRPNCVSCERVVVAVFGVRRLCSRPAQARRRT